MQKKTLHFPTLLIGTICSLAMTVTAWGAVSISDSDVSASASTEASDSTSGVIICGGVKSTPSDEELTLGGPGTVGTPVSNTTDVPNTAAAPSTVGASGKSASEVTGTKGESLGIFTTTGYCTCTQCCSAGWTLTYSGTVPKANHTISADINHYPIGTRLMIDDVIYTVEDIGTHVEGSWVDIYYDNHDDAVAHGMKQQEVFTVLP